MTVMSVILIKGRKRSYQCDVKEKYTVEKF